MHINCFIQSLPLQLMKINGYTSSQSIVEFCLAQIWMLWLFECLWILLYKEGVDTESCLAVAVINTAVEKKKPYKIFFYNLLICYERFLYTLLICSTNSPLFLLYMYTHIHNSINTCLFFSLQLWCFLGNTVYLLHISKCSWLIFHSVYT